MSNGSHYIKFVGSARKRKQKFTSEELEVLVQQVEKYRNVIATKSSDLSTNRSKAKVWNLVSTAINAVGTVRRTPEEVRRKWHDWTSVTRLKENQLRQAMAEGKPRPTGLSPLESKLLYVMGEYSITSASSDVAFYQDSAPQYNSSSCAVIPTVKTEVDDSEIDIACQQPCNNNSASINSPSLVHNDFIEKDDYPPDELPLTSNENYDTKEHTYINKASEFESVSRGMTDHSYETRCNLNEQLLMINREKLELEKRRTNIEEQRLEVEREKVALLRAITQRFLKNPQNNADLPTWIHID